MTPRERESRKKRQLLSLRSISVNRDLNCVVLSSFQVLVNRINIFLSENEVTLILGSRGFSVGGSFLRSQSCVIFYIIIRTL